MAMVFNNSQVFNDAADAAQRAKAADNAPYGSIAQRDDPSNYGSVLRAKYPGAFAPKRTTQEEDEEGMIKANQRVLQLHGLLAQRAAMLDNPRAAQQLAVNNQKLALRRQNYSLEPQDLSGILGNYDDASE